MLKRGTSPIVFSASRGAPITTASASSVFGAGNLPYCTFPVTEALPVMVNVQVAVLLPPLEHAPDQMATRPLLTLKVIELLVVKPDDCVLPTATLMPTGLDTTRSPLRPLAVTVKLTPAAAGFTVSAAVLVTPTKTAEMVAEVEAVTEVVVTVKLALLAPAGTVTLAGTVAAVELSESDTTAPPVGAALVRVNVPCDVAPPVTLVGFSASVLRLAGGGTGVTVSVAVRDTPPNEPVMIAEVEVITDVVVTVKVVLVAPAATVTLAGTVAVAALLESVTTAPPVGAAALKVAVPVEKLPPTTLVGFTDTADKLAAARAVCGVKRHVAENGPNTPAEFCARTRHHKRCAGRPPMVACDTLTIWFALKGAAMVEESST